MHPRLSLSDACAHRWCARLQVVLAGLAGCGLVGQALAQDQTVYRCGQAYTNAPVAGMRCERLPDQQVTVIEGTRVQRAAALALPNRAQLPVAAASAPQTDAATAQAQRDEQARTVLRAEYERTRERLNALQQEQRQLQTASPSSDSNRLQSLEQALARAQRDLQSLQRELDRKPVAGGVR